MPTTTSQHQRTAAITDAGRGLGRDIALGLAAKNHCVYGTAISAEEIADLEQASGGFPARIYAIRLWCSSSGHL